MMPTLQYCLQQISGINDTTQVIINRSLGFGDNQYSQQEAINIAAGLAPYSRTFEEALYANISGCIALNPTATYTEQELVKLAYDRSLSINQVLRGELLLSEVKSALPWYAFYWPEVDPNYSEGARVGSGFNVTDLMGTSNRNLQGASTAADQPFWETDSVVGKRGLHFVDSGDRVFRDTAQWGTVAQPSMSTWVYRGNDTTNAQTLIAPFGGSHDIILRTATTPHAQAAFGGTVIRGVPPTTQVSYAAAGYYDTNDSLFWNNNMVTGLDPLGTASQEGMRMGRNSIGTTPALDAYVFGGGVIKDGSNRPHRLDGWATWERFVTQEFPAASPVKYSTGGTQKVVIMGDSILDQPQTQIETELADKALLFNAMGASQAVDWLPRALVVGDTSPDVLVLCLGTNDLYTHAVPQATMETRYTNIINRVNARKTICFTLYTGSGSVAPSAFTTFNSWLTTFVASRSDCVIYDWNTIGQANGWIADGWGHPTDPAGRQGLADGIEALIEA